MIRGGTIEPDYRNNPPWREIQFPCHTDERGSLTVAQVPEMDIAGPMYPDESELPFTPARVYWLADLTGDSTRGAHAVFGSESILIPLRGHFTIKLDDGHHWQEEIELRAPDRDGLAVGVHLHSGVWRDLVDFMDTTIVLCMASKRYEDTDYVRDRMEFQKRVAEIVHDRNEREFMRRQAAKRDLRHWSPDSLRMDTDFL